MAYQLAKVKTSPEDSQQQPHHSRNVHSKLYYLDRNLRNFCLLYYTTYPGHDLKQEKYEAYCHLLILFIIHFLMGRTLELLTIIVEALNENAKNCHTLDGDNSRG